MEQIQFHILTLIIYGTDTHYILILYGTNTILSTVSQGSNCDRERPAKHCSKQAFTVTATLILSWYRRSLLTGSEINVSPQFRWEKTLGPGDSNSVAAPYALQYRGTVGIILIPA